MPVENYPSHAYSVEFSWCSSIRSGVQTFANIRIILFEYAPDNNSFVAMPFKKILFPQMWLRDIKTKMHRKYHKKFAMRFVVTPATWTCKVVSTFLIMLRDYITCLFLVLVARKLAFLDFSPPSLPSFWFVSNSDTFAVAKALSIGSAF